MYGQVIPRSGDTYLGAPGAIIDGELTNNFAFTGGSSISNVTIEDLQIQNFIGPQNSGVINQGSGPGWTIEHDLIWKNPYGAAIFLGNDNTAAYNCLTQNGQYGFQGYTFANPSVPTYNVTLEYNEISYNDTYDYETKQPGCGCTGGGKFWNVYGANVQYNNVHDNYSVGLWADTNNVGFDIENNYITNNHDEGIFYEISYNANISNNYLAGNANRAGQTSSVPAIYISESGGDARANSVFQTLPPNTTYADGAVTGYTTVHISGNDLVNNWGGVSLWENSNRFCGTAPYNTSSSYCTIVNSAATPTSCSANVASTPYFSDCRWKTQNVSVDNNIFTVGSAPTCQGTCGIQSLFSNYGSTAPYTGAVVENNIAYNQNNRFFSNTYTGNWQFEWSSGQVEDLNQWQGSPISQDSGSTLNGGTSPASIPGNLMDADSAGFEGTSGAGTGSWSNWYDLTANSIAQSTAQAEAGTHGLQVNINALYGWGIQGLPGWNAAPGSVRLSFWAKAPTPIAGLNAMLTVNWLSASGGVLSTSAATLATVTSSWQQGTANVTAPAGTTNLSATITGSNYGTGSLYLDQVSVTPNPVPPPNVLDPGTANLEGSLGHWARAANGDGWYGDKIGQSSATAAGGFRSLLVSVTAPYGWGVNLDDWPGFTASPGPATVSFWAMSSTAGLGATMTVIWYSASNTSLGSTSASVSLATTWQQVTATGTAPAGTTHAYVTITGTTNTTGDSLYFDQLYVGT